jgi:GNAT superfamily N-acetyltransferase
MLESDGASETQPDLRGEPPAQRVIGRGIGISAVERRRSNRTADERRLAVEEFYRGHGEAGLLMRARRNDDRRMLLALADWRSVYDATRATPRKAVDQRPAPPLRSSSS